MHLKNLPLRDFSWISQVEGKNQASIYMQFEAYMTDKQREALSPGRESWGKLRDAPST